jgi:hypothetical protein
MSSTHSRLMGCAAIAALVIGLVPGTARAITLSGPRSMTWDVQDATTGVIMYGYNYAYSNCYSLTVNGTGYNAGGTAGTTIWSGRGIDMATQTVGTLRVKRTAWVPASGTYDYLRYYDTIENTGTSTVSVTAVYGGYLGVYSGVVFASSNGDSLVSLADTWYCVRDSYGWSGSSGHVWYDSGALNPTAMTFSYSSLSTTFHFDVPAGRTAALMIFAVQDSSDTAIQATATYLAGLPEASLTGLTSSQMGDILNWPAGGAPIIRLVTETLEVVEGDSLDLEVDVEDLEGDAFTVYWELNGDGFFDDGTGLTATFDALGRDGPSTAPVSVRAQDATEERIFTFDVDILNAPPVFISDPAVDPGLNAYRGRKWEYHLEVEDPANADGIVRDPTIITVPEKPDGMIYFGDQHFEWTPKLDGSDVGRHTLRIEADDRDGDPAVQEVTIEVMENSPPEAPTIISPDMVTVSSVRPTLVIGNASDFDGDMLSYTFEVATTEEFTTVVAQGRVFEDSSGQTEWVVATTLFDATRYYWRAWANDGRNDGPADESWFDVDTSLAPDDTDASTDVVDDIPAFVPPEGGGDCGCTLVSWTGWDGGVLWATCLAALLVLALALRPRRRGDDE